MRGFGLADDAALDDHIAARFHMRRFDRALHHHIAGHAYRHAGADIARHAQRAIERDVAGMQIDGIDVDHRADDDAIGQHAGRAGDHGQQQVRIIGIGGHAGQSTAYGHVHHRVGGNRLAQHVHAVLAHLGRRAAHQRGTRIDQQQAAEIAQVHALVFVLRLDGRGCCTGSQSAPSRPAQAPRRAHLAAFATARLQRNADRRSRAGHHPHRSRRGGDIFGRDGRPPGGISVSNSRSLSAVISSSKAPSSTLPITASISRSVNWHCVRNPVTAAASRRALPAVLGQAASSAARSAAGGPARA
jgi:hypothetical protein